jgi:hypothetical protein
MLQEVSIIPAIESKTEVRALGVREHMFWLMDQKHPAHLTVTAEVKGITKVQSWRDALDAVQRRHPILSTSIKRNEEGQPALYQVDAAPIPLQVVDGRAQERWELELDREMALPFTPEQAFLIRSVLILKLEAIWGPTALQGLEGEQNVGAATTNGAIRLLDASYSLIPHLLENIELILRAACGDIRD